LFESLELRDRTQAGRCFQLTYESMPTTLVVRWWPESPRRLRLPFDSAERAVKRQVEVQPRLLAVCDNVQSRGDLIMNGRDHCIFLHFGNIRRTKLDQVP
jgi:hypothetical protein